MGGHLRPEAKAHLPAGNEYAFLQYLEEQGVSVFGSRIETTNKVDEEVGHVPPTFVSSMTERHLLIQIMSAGAKRV